MNLHNFNNRPYPFFLISSMRHKEWGRFSFIGSDPFLVLKSKGNNITIEQGGKITHKKGDPLEELRSILNIYKVRYNPKSPAPFMGGGVGYLGYDLCHSIEKLPSTTKDDLKFPDIFLAFYNSDSVVPFNSVMSFGSAAPCHKANQHRKNTVKSNFTKQEYLKAVRRVKEYISAGDIYQAIELFGKSLFMKEIMGDSVHRKYMQLKNLAADRCPRALGTRVKFGEVLYHHEVTNQLLWSRF